MLTHRILIKDGYCYYPCFIGEGTEAKDLSKVTTTGSGVGFKLRTVAQEAVPLPMTDSSFAFVSFVCSKSELLDGFYIILKGLPGTVC